MKGKFKTPDGKEVSVIEYDEPNNILFAKFPNGNRIWVGKKEYSTWESLGGEEVPKTKHIHIPDMPAQMTEQQADSVNYDLETDGIKSEQTEIIQEEEKEEEATVVEETKTSLTEPVKETEKPKRKRITKEK